MDLKLTAQQHVGVGLGVIGDHVDEYFFCAQIDDVAQRVVDVMFSEELLGEGDDVLQFVEVSSEFLLHRFSPLTPAFA